MKDYIDIFTVLGQRLASFGSDTDSQRIIEQAIEANPWFTHCDICCAVDAIRSQMLDETKLRLWMADYNTISHTERVAVIMAGNIPLVGFFDLMCVVMAGHECHVKLSSKDTVLMRFIIDELKSIDSSIPIFDYQADQHYDKVIATGGDDANRYFEEHFNTTRRLLRGSRHSVAILDGNESDADIEALVKDITTYSGMGCRSVSMIFALRSKQPILKECCAANAKLARNIASMRALYTMQGERFADYGGFLLVEGNDFPTSLTNITLCLYDDLKDVRQWLDANDERIQCVVTNIEGVERSVAFGLAQYPTLWDYADGVDTMRFLLD